jgi:hypothetical protein
VLLLEKQRMGPTGEIKLWFDDKYTTFRNVTEKRYSNNSEERQRWVGGNMSAGWKAIEYGLLLQPLGQMQSGGRKLWK